MYLWDGDCFLEHYSNRGAIAKKKSSKKRREEKEKGKRAKKKRKDFDFCIFFESRKDFCLGFFSLLLPQSFIENRNKWLKWSIGFSLQRYDFGLNGSRMLVFTDPNPSKGALWLTTLKGLTSKVGSDLRTQPLLGLLTSHSSSSPLKKATKKKE